MCLTFPGHLQPPEGGLVPCAEPLTVQGAAGPYSGSFVAILGAKIKVPSVPDAHQYAAGFSQRTRC